MQSVDAVVSEALEELDVSLTLLSNDFVSAFSETDCLLDEGRFRNVASIYIPTRNAV